MNKRAYLYIAALLGITSPFYAAPASAAQTYSKTAMHSRVPAVVMLKTLMENLSSVLQSESKGVTVVL